MSRLDCALSLTYVNFLNALIFDNKEVASTLPKFNPNGFDYCLYENNNRCHLEWIFQVKIGFNRNNFNTIHTTYLQMWYVGMMLLKKVTLSATDSKAYVQRYFEYLLWYIWSRPVDNKPEQFYTQIKFFTCEIWITRTIEIKWQQHSNRHNPHAEVTLFQKYNCNLVCV